MSTPPVHTTHVEISKRLKRAQGHLLKIVEMIESRRSCSDIAQQLQAVEKAVSAAKKTLIHDHIDHCLDQVASNPSKTSRSSVDEFKAITKYL